MRIGKRTIVVGSLLVIFLGIFPIVAERDSYPHSHLPMFSINRGEIARIDTAIGITEENTVIRLGPRLIANTDEVVMAKDAIVNAIRRKTTQELCREIAERVSTTRDDLREIQINTDLYNTVEWFKGNRNPIQIERHATCEVGK